ncbi:hypothetical protein [uncultured Dysgonomonas sp.]|uniref:Uncharacterized protein n=1 Tax=uncultured Dysgonomonas sp. TaxID=206096 RepID=A0A212IWT6_9BACT|nr:hypothetical protein [uncultured Dysgonomonas sp.]SBV91691.1 hypothetical protein KL86DYS1_10405 [uncultured Dysgonomonas sp.]
MYYKRVLYDAEIERYNSLTDKNQKSIYVLLKYWKDRPRRWEKIWNELYAVYQDDSGWEYLVANHLYENGLDWIGEYEKDEETGDEYIKDPAKTWVTSELGKKHIKDDFFNLGYKPTPKEIRANRLEMISIGLAGLAIIVSMLVYLFPKDRESDIEYDQRLEYLEKEIKSISKKADMLKIQMDSLIDKQSPSINYE